MHFASLMVHLDLDQRNDARLKIAGDLALRFDARVIGIAARAEPVPLDFSEGFAAATIIEQGIADIEKRLREAEQRFRSALSGRIERIEWRSAVSQPFTFITEACRAADLVIVGSPTADMPPDPELDLAPADLILNAGRPVLMVPPEVDKLTAEHILVAWKDTPQSRRAVSLALPFLRACRRVVVATIDEDNDPGTARASVDDVVAWLGCHGVPAIHRIVPPLDDVASGIESLAREDGADLVVSGAYGHGKIREWVFGSVTKEFLRQTGRCHFLTH
jgi:nucleotide-binding universal stress UspA family protein